MRLSLNFCLYVNPHEHLDPAAVSSAGKCTGKKKKAWNCIWDTPALSRSAGLWKSSLFSLAVLRKSHRALCRKKKNPHNEGSQNRRPDLLFWPRCVFTPLSLQQLGAAWLFSSKRLWPPLQTRPSVGRLAARRSRNTIRSASIDYDAMTQRLYTRTRGFAQSLMGKT